ncbi:hypothetical protein [Jidongwangia harbinensis]|uniref:hypothetical protein n=1 Tax=Jidongwangia harbinensis TaxID=2878561 RepID=UPI001CD9AB0C|nr:hypothetical protein [Jidongwangia harbinensis]MCA2214759.1 hypothetical protein [Jidongwangia harbinensis]
MTELTVLAAVASTLLVIVFAEVAAAVLPLLIVLIFVPPEERDSLARLLATCDNSRRLRLWPALRTAVVARREQRLAVHRDREAAFRRARGLEWPINPAHGRDPAFDRPAANRP